MRLLTVAACSLLLLAPAIAQRPEALLQRVDSEKGISISMRVETLEGKLLLDHDGDSARVLASNTKLLTTSAAVLALDPDSRWTTRCYLIGDELWIVGDGDPSLRRTAEADGGAAFLDALTAALKTAEAQNLSAIVLDARAFGEELRPPGWPADQLDKNYCAPSGALQVEGSCLSIDVVGGQVQLQPPLDKQRQVNWTSRKKKSLSAWWLENDKRVAVRGGQEGVGPVVLVAVHPLGLFQTWLLYGLKQRGIAVAEVREPSAEEVVPEVEPLLEHASLWTLAEAITVVNKNSDNQLAETVLRTLGLRIRGAGTRKAGLEVVREVLGDLGLDLSEVVQVDGSGMSRGEANSNRASPTFLCALLQQIAEQESGRVVFLSLPVAGKEGRSRGRFRDPIFQPGRVRAKTGFISGASSLSGYLQTQDDTVLVFSFIANYKPDGTTRTANARFKKLRQDVLKALLEERPWI